MEPFSKYVVQQGTSMMFLFDACYIFEIFGHASLDFGFSQHAIIGENHMSHFRQDRLKIREIIDGHCYI